MKKKASTTKVKDTNIATVTLLNKAFADEWLAHYQYWVGARVARGPMRPSIVAELEQHAADEHNHATQLADRIIQLGGTPLIHPKDWFKETNCGYDAPAIPHVINIIKQNIKGEQCAIEVYTKLLHTVEKHDPVTYYMILGILKDEEEHKSDLQNLLDDLSFFELKK